VLQLVFRMYHIGVGAFWIYNNTITTVVLCGGNTVSYSSEAST
jgi:hypothetical protein